MQASDIINAIVDGEFDDYKESILAAFKTRSETINAKKRLNLRPGDKVVFNYLTRPKYLQGIEATVEKINSKNVVVRIPAENWDARKFRGVATTTSVSLVDKVEDDVV